MRTKKEITAELDLQNELLIKLLFEATQLRNKSEKDLTLKNIFKSKVIECDNINEKISCLKKELEEASV